MAKKKQRVSKKFIPQASIVSDEIYMPNHSGMLDAGKVHRTPTDKIDPVNKKYVDDSIPASISLFFTKNGSDLGGVYLDMEVDPVTDAEASTLTAIPSNSTGTLMASYATLLADSVIGGIVELPIGVYSFHIHCEASSATKLSMYAELYHRNAGGTETLLLTSEDSNLIPITKGSIGFHGSLITEKEWADDDRIVIKLYGKNNSAASRDLTIYVEGTTATRGELPAIRGSSVGAALWTRAGTVLSPKTAGDDITTTGIFYADYAYGIGLDVLHSANIGDHLIVGNDLTVDGTIINTDFTTLTDNSMADTLHRHSELSASDGTPDAVVTCDADGNVGIGIADALADLHIVNSDAVVHLRFGNSTTGSGITDGLLLGMSDNNSYLWNYEAGNLRFATNNTERVRIDSSGNVGIGVIPTARNNTTLQIKDGVGFPATQVPSTDVNTLDDYKEGTFTVAFVCGTSGTITPSAGVTGKYTKIGNVVYFNIDASIASVSSPVGRLLVTRLPYTSLVSTHGFVWPYNLNAGYGDVIMWAMVLGATSMYLDRYQNGVLHTDVAGAIKAGSWIRLSGHYYV